MKCAIYIRVSTTDQRLLQQFREVRAAVEARGWVIVRVYRERRSARHGAHRPQWEALRREAALRRFMAVAVWSVDRMGRSVVDVLNAVDGFDSRGVQLLTVKDGMDTRTPAGRMVLTVLASVAEMERTMNSERTRAGMAAAKARGVRVGRKPIDVPADSIAGIIDGSHTTAAVARALGVSRSTIRGRVRAAKRGGVQVPRKTRQITLPNTGPKARQKRAV